ncbi:MAG: hypothetical protein QXG48_05395 [Thermofilaceae archaeon]
MPRKNLKEGKSVGLMECPRCGHIWVTTSRLAWVTCPSCMYKVRNPYWKKEDGQRIGQQ